MASHPRPCPREPIDLWRLSIVARPSGRAPQAQSHTGNTFAAAGGAGIKDLIARMGHDRERVAMIYQHQACGADKIIADNIDARVQAQGHGKVMN